MKTYSLYIVDDEQVVLEGTALALKKYYKVRTFYSAENAIEAMKEDPPDLILLDIGLQGMSGIEALEEIKRLLPEMLIIMITAYEDVETVVSAMKLGAYDYVVKPIHIETLLTNIQNALETVKMRKEIRLLQERYLRENLPCFIGESDAIQDMMEVVKKVAKSPDTSVLILGKTGTGKELIANAIHYRSPNFKEPFVSVNCAAIPKELIESELFGYEKGAFTGAAASGKIGLVERVGNGTLFLDEVGDLSMEAQAKLLRFIEEGEFYKVGGTEKRQARIRIISATNRDLAPMMEDNRFREDLYYRLAVVKIEIPSLNKRRDDIVPIAKFFLVEFSRKMRKTFNSLSPNAERALMEYHWRGNVRELRNFIERAVLIADGPELKEKDIGLGGVVEDKAANNTVNSLKSATIPETGIDFPSTLESIEKNYLREALKVAKGNESKAARLLNLSRDTFRYRRKKLNLD
jgi:DNA-binding NtrC family response regulator